jgi:hypothetical protein
VAYNPIAELEQLGVPCGNFEPEVVRMFGSLSHSEVVAFASIWHKANSGGLNKPLKAPDGQKMVTWIFGRAGY